MISNTFMERKEADLFITKSYSDSPSSKFNPFLYLLLKEIIDQRKSMQTYFRPAVQQGVTWGLTLISIVRNALNRGSRSQNREREGDLAHIRKVTSALLCRGTYEVIRDWGSDSKATPR